MKILSTYYIDSTTQMGVVYNYKVCMTLGLTQWSREKESFTAFNNSITCFGVSWISKPDVIIRRKK